MRLAFADGGVVRQLITAGVLVGAVANVTCGSGSSNGSSPAPQTIVTSGANVLPIAVTLGPTNNAANTAFATVTICLPGSAANCQTIDGVMIDTGSSGLRILSSVLTLPLPQENDANGNPIVECNGFLDGYTWGPVQTADVKIAGEQASSVPIQVIGSPTFPSVPDSCSSTGASEDTLDTFGANGLLGISTFRQDCEPSCALQASLDQFYTCPSSGCQPSNFTLAQTLPNPVWMFATDNNGEIVELPSVASAGAASVSGSLVFGIGTQSNNALGSAGVYTLDANGSFTTIYGGQSYGGSFLDTGSNGLYFLGSGTTGLAVCRDQSSFYCPATTQNQTATNQGVNGKTGTVSFSVGNADTLFANATLSALPTLAGPSEPLGDFFDWGLPFFFGRNVFFAIESQPVSGAGTGPFWAY